MKIDQARALQIGARVILRSENGRVSGVVIDVRGPRVRVDWADGRPGAIYTDGSGIMYRLCDLVTD